MGNHIKYSEIFEKGMRTLYESDVYSDEDHPVQVPHSNDNNVDLSLINHDDLSCAAPTFSNLIAMTHYTPVSKIIDRINCSEKSEPNFVTLNMHMKKGRDGMVKARRFPRKKITKKFILQHSKSMEVRESECGRLLSLMKTKSELK